MKNYRPSVLDASPNPTRVEAAKRALETLALQQAGLESRIAHLRWIIRAGTKAVTA